MWLSAPNLTGVGVRQSPQKDMGDRSALHVPSLELVSKICSLDKGSVEYHCAAGTVLGAFMKLRFCHYNLSPKSCLAHCHL